MAESEVFRLTPEVGRCYEYAESTRKQGKYQNEQYFTTNTPRYVGKFLRTTRGGDRDGEWAFSIFEDNDGKEQRVDYSYEGTTCFREVPCTMSSLADDPIKNIIGGKSKRRRKNIKTKRRKRKRRKNKTNKK
jgi:hypothetical protein